MWIKICANTNLEDTLLAAELGADAVGFVFASSKRQVTLEQVAAITPHLPKHVEKIGVFTTSDYDEIRRTVEVAGLTGVQLHGPYDLRLGTQLRGNPHSQTLDVIYTVPWIVDGDDESIRAAGELLVEIGQGPAFDTRILLDSKVRGASGGTGIAFDWSQVRAVVDGNHRLQNQKIIVAGGLNPDNVADAIRALNPWGVDVASGVEEAPGRKAPERLRRFIEAARAVRL